MSFSIRSSEKLALTLSKAASKPATPVTLQQTLAFGRHPQKHRLLSAQFLQKELPIRFAHRIMQLDNLPYGLAKMPTIIQVRDLYVQSFMKIAQLALIDSEAADEEFTELLEKIKNAHTCVVPLMARGLLDLKQVRDDALEKHASEIDPMFDSFFMARIGIRMLIGQHVASSHTPGGRIDVNCSPVRIAAKAISVASRLCETHLGRAAPAVELAGQTQMTLTYVPSHLEHMLCELLKNSMRATMEFHSDAEVLPPIRVIFAGGVEDVVLKIVDQGGGIPLSLQDKQWSYLFTTADPPAREDDSQVTFREHHWGYGYGLPISRLFARYFGGDLAVISMEGYGSDALLHLNRLTDVSETLPDDFVGDLDVRRLNVR